MTSVVTPRRYAAGMTFDEYVTYIGTPHNLERESGGAPTSGGALRRDYSAFFREAFDRSRLTDEQRGALKWLVAQPHGPAKMLAISEEWSSDCRRDVPMFARIAADTGMELRIFCRDGQRFSDSHVPTLAEAPDSNADIMAEFLNHKHGQTWQSIPVCVFFSSELEHLYHYTEYPAIYAKDRIREQLRQAKPGESPEQAQARYFEHDFPALQASDFFRVWACAAVDEMISALHRRLLLGSV
jgi:thioredoxin family protein